MNTYMNENILIVYYSYSGKTRRIAEEIQKQTGGRLSQIYPRQPYPADFECLLKQVREENRFGKLPALLPLTESADRYDIVFVGSPDWCGTIAPPLGTWLDKNDMTGKVILPFFSHCGGEDKGMEQAVRNRCPETDMKKTLYVLENSSESLPHMVQEWLKHNFPPVRKEDREWITGRKK